MIVIVLAALGAGGVFALRSVHSSSQGGLSRQLPASFSGLHPGMTESAVAAELGKPLAKSENPKFVHKSPQEWAKIQAQVDAGAAYANDPSTVPSLQIIRLRMELQHRIKDIWTYQPNKYATLLLDFDDTGHLIKWGTVAVMPAGARGSAPGKHAAREKALPVTEQA